MSYHDEDILRCKYTLTSNVICSKRTAPDPYTGTGGAYCPEAKCPVCRHCMHSGIIPGGYDYFKDGRLVHARCKSGTQQLVLF